jgi:esterase/lipase superfamily enzyme
MGAVSEYATTVVRLFPDYADSAVWFRSPVPYQKTRLDARLIAELQAWDASYCAGLTCDHEWRTPELAAQFYPEGARVARLVADQPNRLQTRLQSRWGGSRARVPQSVSLAVHREAVGPLTCSARRSAM